MRDEIEKEECVAIVYSMIEFMIMPFYVVPNITEYDLISEKALLQIHSMK